jgi:hypothetical protein
VKSSGIVIRKNRKGFAVVFPQPLTIQWSLNPARLAPFLPVF